eukprot:NODE_5553_length_934_cov_22.136868_g5330_i0.p1 GENE.NODE_5553_length_934_cov_22.136868_g5330_i0~~NODE_5553_length_934_cov_22.136868_g5330_i0.p1  ORF type:complete len:264 (-),score=39.64 NODE_5553_length_934_cov_22.136868_g5330_i0:82-873(-)
MAARPSRERQRFEEMLAAAEEADLDARIQEVERAIVRQDRLNAQLETIASNQGFVGVNKKAPQPKVKARPVPRVVVLLDRENRGQKFMENVSAVPPNWTVHIMYNPHSKNKLDTNIGGDVRHAPCMLNEPNSVLETISFVAGRVSEQEDPELATVYFVFNTEHDGRHEEVIGRLEENGFNVERCSSHQFSFSDLLEHHEIDSLMYARGAMSTVDPRPSKEVVKVPPRVTTTRPQVVPPRDSEIRQQMEIRREQQPGRMHNRRF